MNKISIHNQNFIRFKRWSRKNYAVFAGLNKIISIGKITVEICEKSLQKTFSNITEFLTFNKESNDSELDENNFNCQINELQLLAVNTPIVSTGISHQDYTYLNNSVLLKRLFFRFN